MNRYCCLWVAISRLWTNCRLSICWTQTWLQIVAQACLIENNCLFIQKLYYFNNSIWTNQVNFWIYFRKQPNLRVMLFSKICDVVLELCFFRVEIMFVWFAWCWNALYREKSFVATKANSYYFCWKLNMKVTCNIAL